jgi:hypothetical protein
MPGFQKTHHIEDVAERDRLDIKQDAPGELTVIPLEQEAELVTEEAQSSEGKLTSLIEKAASLVDKFTLATSNRLEVVEDKVMQLVDGSLSIEELSQQYGELSVADSDRLKNQLNRVLNSIQVETQKTLVEREGIKLQKERALTGLYGLRAAFEIQSATERTADAQDEANYQADKRAQNNVARDNHIEFLQQRNDLNKADQDNLIQHKTKVNEFRSKMREAVRRGIKADLNIKTFHADRKETAVTRIKAAVEANKQTKAKDKKNA